jgi:predicted dehydrogenase
MSELRIGIVGLGWVAGAHIEALKNVEGATVSAVCSRRQHDPAELEATYGLPLRAYTSFEDLLADDEIDVIDICTPNHLHAQQAIAAARAGKHLIIEKPVATSFEDCVRVQEAIEAAGVLAMVCFECRYSAHFSLVKSILDEGLIGDLHYAEVDYFHGIGPWYGQFPWNVKKDVGTSSLATAGCHALDALLFFMDRPVDEVSAFSTRSSSEIFAPYEYDTTHVSLLRFADGAVGKCASVVDCLQPYYFHLHLVGSHGSILDNKFYSHKLKGMNKDRWSELQTALIDSGDVADHPYQPQFQAFVEGVAAGRPMPLTDYATALETHRVMFAADLSAAESRPVRPSEL